MAKSLQVPHALSHHTTAFSRSNPGFEARALRLSLPQNRSYQTISTGLSSVTRYNGFRLASLVVYALGSRTNRGKRSSWQTIVAEGSDSKARKIQTIAQKVFNFLAKTPIKVFLRGLEKVVGKVGDTFKWGVKVLTFVDTTAVKAEVAAKKVEGIAEGIHGDLDKALGVNHDNGKANPVISTKESTSTEASAP